MDPRFSSAIATFGAGAKAKLVNPAVQEEPEEKAENVKPFKGKLR